MQIRTAAACALLVCSAALTPSAYAQHERYHDRGWRGDIHRFHEHDIGRWRAGHWVHGRHGRTFGWWWVVDGIYYPYAAPVYPFPDPYTPPATVAAPAPAARPPAAGPPGTWYYCDSPRGYYPYVPQCQTAWRPVPASPPPG